MPVSHGRQRSPGKESIDYGPEGRIVDYDFAGDGYAGCDTDVRFAGRLRPYYIASKRHAKRNPPGQRYRSHRSFRKWGPISLRFSMTDSEKARKSADSTRRKRRSSCKRPIVSFRPRSMAQYAIRSPRVSIRWQGAARIAEIDRATANRLSRRYICLKQRKRKRAYLAYDSFPWHVFLFPHQERYLSRVPWFTIRQSTYS